MKKEISMKETNNKKQSSKKETVTSNKVKKEKKSIKEVKEISIGDYVLAGGEVASIVMLEAISRLIPGVLGNEDSVKDDSFAQGSMEKLIEGPVFTRPENWRGLEVPEVLLSGDHQKIALYRLEKARKRTRQNRPDLAQ